jgi:predicted ATPase/transcriptional regulator with XRE-family HTH domain
MEGANEFGSWLKRRRRELDLTQQALADCAACSPVTIRKFEAGERRPSRELAELLSGCLGIPSPHQDAFVAFARGVGEGFTVGAVTPLASDAATGMNWPQSRTWNRHAPLPIPPTPFVGRVDELAQIATRLEDPECRLLTLVGPGGMGKTRLALAAAEALRPRFADGVAFVSLATIHDAGDLPHSIAHALDLSLGGNADLGAQLASYLYDKRLLLVLDNFESVLDGADSLGGLLQPTPGAKWLVTSRERLDLAEEWLLPVQGLNTPEAGMKLFAQIAERLQPEFSLAAHAPVVAQICAYVGGMPLAIELAAGWAASLSCEQILAQMQQTFDFLSTSLRNVPQRHRSLRQLFDQSWRLLPPQEQKVLMKLSVFRGGFAPEEAVRVAGATVSLLHSLVGKALVLPDGRGRYDLHALVRRYATERLQASVEEEATRQQHLQVYVALAEAFDLGRGGPEGFIGLNG